MHQPSARPPRPMSVTSESMGSTHSRARRSWHCWHRWRLDRDHQAVCVAKLRIDVSRVCRVEAAVVKINLPLELTDQPIRFDEDRFARIDRVKAMLTPFLTPRRCHHPTPARTLSSAMSNIPNLGRSLGVAALPADRKSGPGPRKTYAQDCGDDPEAGTGPPGSPPVEFVCIAGKII